MDNQIFGPRPSADSDLRSVNAYVIVCNLGSAVHPHLVFTTIIASPSDGVNKLSARTAEFYDASEGSTKAPWTRC